MKQHPVIPLYCPICNHLTFFYRTSQTASPVVVDFHEGEWSIHPCFLVEPELIEKDPYYRKLNAFQDEKQKLPFFHQNRSAPSKPEPLSIGVVLSRIADEASRLKLLTLTPDNSIIDVKCYATSETGNPGTPIHLKGATRTGRGKYRIQKVSEVIMPQSFYPRSPETDTLIELILTARDQEQLETCLDRILFICCRHRTLPTAVRVRPIKNRDSTQEFGRILFLPLVDDMRQSIGRINLPESVGISIRELGLSTSE